MNAAPRAREPSARRQGRRGDAFPSGRGPGTAWRERARIAPRARRAAPALCGKKSRVALGRGARRRRERAGASQSKGTPAARLAFRGFHRKVSSFRANSPPGLANAAAALCRVAAPGPRRPRRGTGTDQPQQPPPRAAASARPEAGSPRLAPRRGPRPRRAGRPRPPAPPRGPRRARAPRPPAGGARGPARAARARANCRAGAARRGPPRPPRTRGPLTVAPAGPPPPPPPGTMKARRRSRLAALALVAGRAAAQTPTAYPTYESWSPTKRE